MNQRNTGLRLNDAIAVIIGLVGIVLAGVQHDYWLNLIGCLMMITGGLIGLSGFRYYKLK